MQCWNTTHCDNNMCMIIDEFYKYQTALGLFDSSLGGNDESCYCSLCNALNLQGYINSFIGGNVPDLSEV